MSTLCFHINQHIYTQYVQCKYRYYICMHPAHIYTHASYICIHMHMYALLFYYYFCHCIWLNNMLHTITTRIVVIYHIMIFRIGITILFYSLSKSITYLYTIKIPTTPTVQPTYESYI